MCSGKKGRLHLEPRRLISSFAILIGLAGCATPPASNAPPPATPPAQAAPATAPSSLQARLDAFQANWDASMPPNRARACQGEIAEIRRLDVADHALGVGAGAPDFSLPGTSGEPVQLAQLLRSGPVVVLWYRGGWSPHCTLTLRAYQEVRLQIQALGATLVAISPQTLDNSLATQELCRIEFDLLSDAGNRAARAYGLVYVVPEAVRRDYGAWLELEEYNGDKSHELPLTATYVIDPAGTIRYAFVAPDYRKRGEPADVLATLRQIRGQ